MKKSVLVTGASRGIGLEICKRLIKKEKISSLIMVARPSREFNKVVKDIKLKAGNCKVVGISADLSNPEEALKIYNKLDDKGIKLTGIINNAGFTKPALIGDTTLKDFEHTFNVNLFAPFRLIQEALARNYPLTHIINIASTAGINGRSGWLSYSTSKAAMINMSQVLSEELSKDGIQVVCLSPGRCATDLRKTLVPDEDPKTIMQPEQVASIVDLMLSNKGSLISSENIVVRT